MSSWEDKGERRSRAARKPGMAGAWRRGWTPATGDACARSKTEEERERETDRWAQREIFIFFLFFPWAVTNDVTKPRCVKGHMS